MSFSKIASYIFHPVFMPISIFFLLISRVEYFDYIFAFHCRDIYIILFIFTVCIPICVTLLFSFFLKKSIYLENRKDRILPYFFSLISVLVGYVILSKIITLDTVLLNIYLSLFFILLFAFLITLYWKTSLHMTSIGSAVAICIYINILFGDFFWITIYCIIISGIVGFARLNLRSHNLNQVLFGFLSGLTLEMLLLFNYNLTTLKISTFLSNIASLL